MNKIVAIVGMCGSGKSVACEYFESIGYKKIYFGGVTLEILKEKNLEVTPENEKIIRESLRKEHGMGAYATVLLPKIEEEVKTNNVVLDGLYSWSELKILKDKFGDILSVIAITCDKNLRYERISKREIRPLTNEEAIRRDTSEIENLEKGGPIAYADYYVLNNGTVLDFHNRLKEILNK